MSSNHRSGGRAFLLFHENTSLGWRVIHRVTAENMERRVDRQTARYVTNELGKVIGCQLFSRVAVQATGDRRSCVAISRVEMERLAGTAFEGGVSRTAHLTEAQKLERAQKTNPASGRRFVEEDAVELAVAKVRAYPTLGGEQSWREDVRARVAKARALRAALMKKKTVAR